MDITLTRAQWQSLTNLVSQAKLAELSMDLPIEISNGDNKIEVSAEATEIELAD